VRVPGGHKAICKGVSKAEDWGRIYTTEMREFATFMGFVPNAKLIDPNVLRKALPEFDFTINERAVNTFIELVPKFETGMGILSGDSVVLENHSTQILERWGIFEREGETLWPVSLEVGDVNIEPIHEVGLGITLDDTKVPLNTENLGLMIEATRLNDKTLRDETSVAAWFAETLIMDVPGDGYCAVHALQRALEDINISMSYDFIYTSLCSLEKGTTSWFNAQTLREFCENIHVRLLIKDVSRQYAVYSWTTNNDLPVIGLWANGVHYQWCKRIKPLKTDSPDMAAPSVASHTRSRKSVSFTDDSIKKSIADNIKSPKPKSNFSDYAIELGSWHNGRVTFDDNTRDLPIDLLSPEAKEKAMKFGFKSGSVVKCPIHLISFLNSRDAEDASIEYTFPEPIVKPNRKDIYAWQDFKHVKAIIPKRLDAPLIRLPQELAEAVFNNTYRTVDYVQPQYRQPISGLAALLQDCQSELDLKSCNVTTEINHLKQLIRLSYGFGSDILADTVESCTRKFVKDDFEIAMGATINFDDQCTPLPRINSFHVLLTTLRNLLVNSQPGKLATTNMYSFILMKDGRYILKGLMEGSKFWLMGCGNLFFLKHQNYNRTFIGTSVYLDYTITYTEVRQTIKLMISTSEYQWLRDIASILLELSEMDCDHNESVTLMKTFEGLALHCSDLINTPYINWNPALDTIKTFVASCNKCTGEEDTIESFFDTFYGNHDAGLESPMATRFFSAMCRLNGKMLQEVSSIHKFLFYAEVDLNAGIDRYLERVHTKRPTDDGFIQKMVFYARKMFTLEYIKRHGIAPRFKVENDATNQIHYCVRNKSTEQLAHEALQWWSDVIPYKCLSAKITENILEVAKDKGALKEDIKFAPGDSRRELLQVIEATSTPYEELDLDAIPENVLQRIFIQKCELHPVPDKYCVRCIAKEKEQKLLVRYFGNAIMKHKHGLSYKMLKAKQALSYFDSEMMTKPDKVRKLKLHNMAQELNKPGIFNLMLDIEGHNQSMQKQNAGPIYEFVGLLFGEENWSKLADYFTALTVYFYDEFYDHVVVSQGQLGGIEGWLNPLWTLHSTIVTEMIPIETTIKQTDRGVYSDDVTMNIELMDPTADILNFQFTQITQHYGKAGMIVKLSQTALSKNRVTLLRSHYCKGWKSDASIKRLLAVSSMNNGNFASESLEISGITSSCSSALELTENIFTPTLIKWFYTCLVSIRLFAAYLEKPRNSMLWTHDHAPEDVKQLLYYDKTDKDWINKRTNLEVARDIAESATDHGIILPGGMTPDAIIQLLYRIYGVNAHQFQELQLRDLIYFILHNNDTMKDLFFLILTLPTSVGGKGASLLITDMLSGHSDGFHKQLHYLHRWLHAGKGRGKWIEDIMAHTLRVPETEFDKHLTRELCTSTWPSNTYIITTEGMISSRLRKVVRTKCKNKAISKLLALDQYRSSYYTKIADTCKEELQPRIMQFYAENSCFHILDVLIKKIETSSGFCNLIYNLPDFRRKIGSNELNNLDKMFREDKGWFPTLDRDADVLHQLVERRNMMLPISIKHNVEEPLYDNVLTMNGGHRGTLLVVPGSMKTFQDGLEVVKPPVFGNEALYKGELVAEESELSNSEEVICAKLGSVTRWLLNKNGFLPNDYFKDRKPLFVVLCDLALSTLVPYTFEDIFPLVPSTAKGEIFHRTPNMHYKTRAVLRSLPNTANLYNVTLNQEEINQRGLHDSNIHFDYITQRLKLKHALEWKYTNNKPNMRRYHLNDNPYIFDVSQWKNRMLAESIKTEWMPYTTLVARDVNFGKIRYVAASYLNTEDYGQATEQLGEDVDTDLDLASDNIIISLLGQYYRALRKNKMILGVDVSPEIIWEPLIAQLQTKYNLLVDRGDQSNIEIVSKYIKRARQNFIKLNKAYNTNQVFFEAKQHLVDEFEDCEELISNYLLILSQLQKETAKLGKLDTELTSRLELSEMEGTILHPRKNAIESLLIKTLIDHCLVVKQEDDTYIIDRPKTYKMFDLFMEKYIMTIKNAENIKELFDILFLSYDEDDQYHFLERSMDRLDLALKDFIPIDLKMPLDRPDYGHVEFIEKEPIVNPLVEQVRYITDRVGFEIFREQAKLKKLFNLIRHTSQLYAHPGIFQSPTGSDSYASQFGLFKTLKEIGLLKEDDHVLDLTAGRGDGHLALTRLKVSHTSYNREDIFTSLYSAQGIIRTAEYDVLIPNTLDQLEYGSFYHFDISWTGSNNSDFSDTLMYLIKMQKKFSVRLNSIDFDKLPKDWEKEAGNYRFLITIPTIANLFPYQVYLIAYPTRNIDIRDSASIESTHYWKTIQDRFSRLINIKNLLFAPNVSMENSVSILIDKERDPASLCIELLDNREHNAMRSKLNSMIEILANPEMLAMPKHYYQTLQTDHELDIIDCDEDYDATKYGYHKKMIVGGQSKRKQKFWKLTRNKLLEKTEPLAYISLAAGAEDAISKLSYDIPNPKTRGKLAAMVDMMNTMNIQFPVSIDDLASRGDTLINSKDNFLNTSLPYVRSAILLIYHSACLGNYQSGLLYLWSQLKLSNKNPFHIYNQIVVYRKLSGLYHSFRNDLFSNPKDNSVFTRIQTEIIDVGLRNQDVKKYYQTRIDKSKKMFDISRTPDVVELRDSLFGTKSQESMMQLFEKVLEDPVANNAIFMSNVLDSTIDAMLASGIDDQDQVKELGDLMTNFSNTDLGKSINQALENMEDDWFLDE